MGYPWFSNWLYAKNVDSQVEIYEQYTKDAEEAQIREVLQQAELYNTQLRNRKVQITQPFTEKKETDWIAYEDVLNLNRNGMMCFLEIPEVGISMPVYHGTEEAVLEKGAGHVEGSALPVGGTGNRSIILAHTGMNTSKLFSDLSKVSLQDVFYIEVLGRKLGYQVCEIQTVLPEEAERLQPEKDRDLVTLVTCTPYGINSHRLLVTGERISDEKEQEVWKDAEESSDKTSPWLQAYGRAVCNGCLIAAVIFFIRKVCQWMAKKKSEN